jgi:ADP-ribose pyrophosphatase YjhB (NUDIX family)
MPNDAPIAFRSDGSPIYDNAPTVVCVLASPTFNRNELIFIRRKSGLFGLPGGFHMRGETWQQAGVRELYEETGWLLRASDLCQLDSVETDSFGHNMIFAQTFLSAVFDTEAVLDGEALEVLVMNPAEIPIGDWEFPLHYHAVQVWLDH